MVTQLSQRGSLYTAEGKDVFYNLQRFHRHCNDQKTARDTFSKKTLIPLAYSTLYLYLDLLKATGSFECY